VRSSGYQIILIIFVVLRCVAPAWGAKPYKIYVINRYGAWDIVCDAYTVKKDDHVWEILRRKGRIAETDFPRFVSILKDLNPHIKDVNKIYPNQELLVPLKQIDATESAASEGPRYVTIPMIPDVLYDTRTVRPGECLSKIVTACIGVPWHEISGEYFQNLRRLNPRIKDMDLIYPDQIIRVPELAPPEWAAAQPGPVAMIEDMAKLDARERSVTEPGPVTSKEVLAAGPTTEQKHLARVEPPEPGVVFEAETPSAARNVPKWHDLVSTTAAKVGGRLLDSGQCYFPGKGQSNMTLDLEAFPVIELNDGRHLLLETQAGLPPDMEEAIRAFWKDLTIISTDPREAGTVVLEKVFGAILGRKVQKVLDLPALDDGIQVTLRGDWIFPAQDNKAMPPAYCCITLIENPQEYTADSVVKYLAEQHIQVIDILTEHTMAQDMGVSQEKASKALPVLMIDASSHKAFVYRLVEEMGFPYEADVPLSFDYAGFQIKTTVSLIYGKNNLDVVVDFGTFYGEAKSAIETGGLKVLSIKPDDTSLTIARHILEALEMPYTEDLVLFAASRKASKTTSVTIPGLLVSQANQERALLTHAQLHRNLLDFLDKQQIMVMKIKERS
jgi:hypothetical protein